MRADEVLAAVAGDLNAIAPTETAVFRKTKGRDGELTTGDEYVVHMPGPWDGPVRVVNRTATSFRLATLRGHLEAGQVEFRVEKAGIIHSGIGKASFTAEDLRKNFDAFVDAIVKAKPAGAKGKYVKKVAMSSSMGPGVKVDTAELAGV